MSTTKNTKNANDSKAPKGDSSKKSTEEKDYYKLLSEEEQQELQTLTDTLVQKAEEYKNSEDGFDIRKSCFQKLFREVVQDVCDEKGMENPFNTRDQCKIVAQHQAEQYMVDFLKDCYDAQQHRKRCTLTTEDIEYTKNKRKKFGEPTSLFGKPEPSTKKVAIEITQEATQVETS